MEHWPGPEERDPVRLAPWPAHMVRRLEAREERLRLAELQLAAREGAFHESTIQRLRQLRERGKVLVAIRERLDQREEAVTRRERALWAWIWLCIVALFTVAMWAGWVVR